jgi:hypothetical protein
VRSRNNSGECIILQTDKAQSSQLTSARLFAIAFFFVIVSAS